MTYRTNNNQRQIMIYFMFFFFTISAGVTEFPCTFPSPWMGQTFSFTTSGFDGNWKFNTDCQTSVFTTNMGLSSASVTWLCHQITERFLIVRVQGSDNFVCFPIFFNLANPLKFTFGLGASTTFANQTGEFTDICEICKKPTATLFALVPGSPPSPTQPLDCDIPLMCYIPGIPCASNDIIPKGSGCPILTTETSTTTIFASTTTTQEPTTTTPEQTTTTPVPTTTTSEPTTTTPEPTTTTSEPTTTIPEPPTTTTEPTTLPEPKTTTKGHHGHCRKRNHPHP
ncbi:unnamed protein product [Mytilus coruscus]|uniref:Uncharacterized protein n=1 Tax=Mytilus coruscus TaxID=42192 RepID=A0A6J8DJV2_MYTCO|nr:unnamed protein product [Mytilus coruscus]